MAGVLVVGLAGSCVAAVADEPADALRIARASRQVTGSHPYILLKDRGLAARPTVIARSPVGASSTAGPLSRTKIISFGRRTWRLQLEPTGTLLTAGSERMPALTLGLTALITVLVAAMAGILAGSRNRALARVDRASAALRDDIGRREVTEVRLQESENELRHLALHDPLTGLANRTLFYERVEHALATHSRSGTTLAVLFIDLDGFKGINDTYGHGTGDAVLTQVAVRLRHCTRTADAIIRDADEAMYQAKAAGKGRYVMA